MLYLSLSLMLLGSQNVERPSIQLVGDWKVVSYQRAGVECNDDIKSNTTYYFTGKTLITVLRNMHAEYDYQVNGKNDMHDLDLKNKQSKQEVKGLLSLKGNRMTLCLSSKGQRPESFASDQSNGFDLIVLERE